MFQALQNSVITALTKSKTYYTMSTKEKGLSTSRQRLTANTCRDMMNSVAKDITWTVEIEEDFVDHHIPTLDTKLMQVRCCPHYPEGIKTEEHQACKEGYPQIKYSFYRKPTSSKFCMMATSAMPIIVQQTTLTNEVLRRQMNSNFLVPMEERL